MDTALGLVFVVLWASASVAAKIGFHDAKPLTVLDMRFVLAGSILVIANHVVRRRPLPTRGQWRHVVVLGFTNSAGYLGFAWLALREISVGLFALFIATNPFLTAALSRVWLKRPVARREWLGMAVAAIGLGCASLPSLSTSHATTKGLVMAGAGMVIYSFGSVYRGWSKLDMAPEVLNGLQIAVGAVMVLPFAIALHGHGWPPLTGRLIGALAWSVIAVSLVANGLWFRLLAHDAVKASTWLFLTPIFGYIQGAIVLGEPIHAADAAGLVLVLAGLRVAGTFDLSALKRGRASARRATPDPAIAEGAAAQANATQRLSASVDRSLTSTPAADTVTSRPSTISDRLIDSPGSV